MIIYDILIKLPKNVINAFDHDAPPSTATSRAQLCIRYCSNKHTHVAGIALAVCSGVAGGRASRVQRTGKACCRAGTFRVVPRTARRARPAVLACVARLHLQSAAASLAAGLTGFRQSTRDYAIWLLRACAELEQEGKRAVAGARCGRVAWCCLGGGKAKQFLCGVR